MRRWLALTLLLLSAGVQAQGVRTAGDYQVHHSAIPSGFLTVEVARQYGIQRSRIQGVLLVSVKRAGVPVQARIEAQVGPGGGKLQPLRLRAVTTDGVTSYIGSFPIADGESRQFRLLINLPDSEPLEIVFSQQFFDGR